MDENKINVPDEDEELDEELDEEFDEDEDYEELELTSDQEARVDEIYNSVYNVCQIFAENDNLEWDMAYIGNIADYICETLYRNGIKVRFPSIVTEDDGTQYVEEYYGED